MQELKFGFFDKENKSIEAESLILHTSGVSKLRDQPQSYYATNIRGQMDPKQTAPTGYGATFSSSDKKQLSEQQQDLLQPLLPKPTRPSKSRCCTIL